ncbi:acetylornithine transaminase [Geomonas subterranea]|uniref:acetylornithine transaminase n=1 Tax=Geomonas subterranea TaxID=2847989 RepID=UPI001C44F2F7|nr:acetylornithine transaminase [Geomonas subterranea]QXM09240.1 acetylornithine transaminase [Geomonas subterranea]
MTEQDQFDSLMAIAKRPPIIMTHGKGARLVDQHGKEYLDFIQGWAVNTFGHSPEIVVDALTRQANSLINPSPAFYNGPALDLATKLSKNSCFDRVFFTNSGAEANEGAIKLARKWGCKYRGGAYEIVTMENSFHGRTLATMSASGKPQWKELFEPKVPGFLKVPLNDIDAVDAVVTEKTAAVMLEPILGEAGVIPASECFLKELRKLTRERGVLLILDEVQTGMGRTGKLFAYEQSGVEPDIMTLGKGIGAGVPLAAVLAKEEVSCFDPGDQGGTYNGNPLMAAVGCAVLDALIEPQFLERVREHGDYLALRLEELARRHGLGTVQGRGLLLALDLKYEIAEAVVERARDWGLLLNAPRPTLLRFMPALNVSKKDIDEMIGILDGVLSVETFSR